MLYRMMISCPVVIVLASISFNVFYFFMALQMGRFSHNSVMWIVGQLPAIVPALKGDILPFLQIRQMLAAASA